MEFVSISKFAKMIGVSIETLRRWDKEGRFKPHHVTKGGTRIYSTDQVEEFESEPRKSGMAVGYCRVSTLGQKDDLETQVRNVKTYMIAKGYQFEVITDIGSGINYKKKGLLELIDKIDRREIDRVVVLYKDRLLRFGFELVEHLCKINGVELEIIDNTEESKEKELTDDLVQIITVFANRLYGQRSKKTKRLIKEVMENVQGEDDTVAADT